MWINVLQNLGVLLLAVLFSILFYSTNTRKARNKKVQLNSIKE
jgi:hypothetical protein